MAFIDLIRPAPVGGGFAMDDYWVWCGSVIRGEDNRYYMFAARWPKELPFFTGYITHSEVVRAVSDTPEGPYAFQECVLPAHDLAAWDGQMTHNPTIRKSGNTYLLFYIGATYDGPRPTAEDLHSNTDLRQCGEAYPNIRIGVATATSVSGPWTRSEQPILRPRPGKWDCSVVTNPAPCVLDDGRILLYYRSNTPDGLRIGAAMADDHRSEFRRVADDPVLVLDGGNFVEDPFVWRAGGRFEMLAKDMTGGLSGETHAGIHATSDDGLHWAVSSPAKAYSRRVAWDDGSVTVQGCLERPQLLLDDSGRPTYLFAATADGPGGFDRCSRTWNMAIPLGGE